MVKGPFNELYGETNKCSRNPGFGYPIVLVVLIATLLQIGFWMRLGVGVDQSVILELGREYAESGILNPSAKPTSGGGRIPGILMTYLVGTSLRIWPDHRMPAIPLILANAASLLVLGFTTRRLVNPRFAFWFLALYGLSPWRLFNGSVLWEPAFLLLPAAIHMAACAALQTKTKAAASFILGVSIAVAFQFYASFLVLAVATGILVMRKDIHVHWLAAVAGGLFGGIPFLLSAVANGNGDLFAFAPHYKSNVSSVVVTSIANIPKALLYWLRMGSADVGRRFGETALPGLVAKALWALAIGSVLIPLLAAVRSLRTLNPRSLFRPEDMHEASMASKGGQDREGSVKWVLRYALALLISLLLSAAVSPVTIQSWHSVVGMHAACLAPSMLLSDLWSKGHLAARTCVGIFFGIIITASIVLLFWHPLLTGAR
ncbi:hypothetical protein ACFL4G_07775 [Thermodesulfobacteriota bacterium]